MAQIYWRDGFDSALREAKESNRSIVLELYMEGCPHCKRLHDDTHTDAGVAKELNLNYVPVRLEGRQHMDVVKKFNVTGAPTTLVLSSDGKEVHRFAGYLPPADYLKELKKAA
jgi:thioredoxin-related protein